MQNFKSKWLWILVGFLIVVCAYILAINITTNPMLMLGIVALGGFIGSFIAARKSNCGEPTQVSKTIR